MKKEIFIISVLLVLTLISFHYDDSFSNFLVNHRNSYLDSFMTFITTTIVDIIIFLLLIFFIYLNNRNIKQVVLMLCIIIITLLVSSLLKIIIARPRPLITSLVKETSYSFPSNHSSVAFSALPLFMKENKIIGYVWFIIAILIAFARIYTGVHYLSDVLAGALLGYVISIVIIKSKYLGFLL